MNLRAYKIKNFLTNFEEHFQRGKCNLGDLHQTISPYVTIKIFSLQLKQFPELTTLIINKIRISVLEY